MTSRHDTLRWRMASDRACADRATISFRAGWAAAACMLFSWRGLRRRAVVLSDRGIVAPVSAHTTPPGRSRQRETAAPDIGPARTLELRVVRGRRRPRTDSNRNLFRYREKRGQFASTHRPSGKQALRQMVDEDPQLGRNMPAGRPQRHSVPLPRVRSSMTMRRLPSASSRRTVKSGRQTMPCAFSARWMRISTLLQTSVSGSSGACASGRLQRPAFEPAGAGIAVMQAGVALQVGGLARLAVLAQVLGRRHQDAAERAQPAARVRNRPSRPCAPRRRSRRRSRRPCGR